MRRRRPLAGSLWPAIRVSRVDPLTAMRAE
jgi:hypothetical protein